MPRISWISVFRRGPEWLGYLLVLALPFSRYWTIGPPLVPGVFDLYGTAALFLTDLPMLAVFFIQVARPGWRTRFSTVRWLTWPVLLLGLLGLFASLPARVPRLAIYFSLRWLFSLGVYFFMGNRDLPVRRMVKAYLIGLVFQVLIGLGQMINQGPLGLPGELALEAAWPGAAILEVAGTRWLRPYGMTFHPNVLGGFLAIGLILGLPLLQRIWVRLAWILIWLGLLLSFSRSSWLAVWFFLPLPIVWMLVHRPALRRPLLWVLFTAFPVFLIVVAVFLGQFQTRILLEAPTEQRSVTERISLAGLALNIIGRDPVLGVGPGNFSHAVQTMEPAVEPQPVHNVPLLLASEVGLLGGAAWMWIWLAVLYRLVRQFPGLNSWAMAAGSAGLAMAVIGMFDGYPWWLDSGRLLTMLLLGLTARELSPAFASQARNPSAGSLT